MEAAGTPARRSQGMHPSNLISCLWHSDPLPSQILEDATTFFSHSTPHLAQIIPAMDLIDAKLATLSIDETKPSSIRAAATLAKHTLNRYYQATDLSETYRIAMGTYVVSLPVLLSWLPRLAVVSSTRARISLRCPSTFTLLK